MWHYYELQTSLITDFNEASYMHILPVNKICLCYFHNQTIKIIFEINIVICHSYLFAVPYFPFDNSWVILISKSKNLAANELAKQKNIYIILRILTGKKYLQIKLQRLRKLQIWAFGLLVH